MDSPRRPLSDSFAVRLSECRLRGLVARFPLKVREVPHSIRGGSPNSFYKWTAVYTVRTGGRHRPFTIVSWSAATKSCRSNRM